MKQLRHQQGDILFNPIGKDEIPENLKPHESNILAEGEATGHKHAILLSCLDMPGNSVHVDEEGNKIIINASAIQIRHEEHGEVELEPGQWRVGHVNEFDHVEQMARPVPD